MFAYFLMSGFSAFAEDQEYHSIVHKIQNSENHEKLRCLSELTRKYKSSKASEIGPYLEQEIELAEKLGNDSILANAYISQGWVKSYLGNIDEGIMLYKKGLDLAKTNGQGEIQARANSMLGGAYTDIGDFEKGISYRLKAINYHENRGNLRETGRLHMNLGDVYMKSDQGNVREALVHFKIALEIFKFHNDSNKLSIIYLNLAEVYKVMADFSRVIGAYDTCRLYLRAIPEFSRYAGIAAFAEGQFRTEELGDVRGIPLLHKSVIINKTINNRKELTQPYTALASYYLRQEKYDSAEVYALRSLEISKEFKWLTYSVKNYEILARVNEQLQNFSQALKYQKLHGIAKDSLINKEKLQTVKNLQVRYETEQKNLEIQNLNVEAAQQDRVILLGIIIILAVLIILLLSINRWMVAKRKNKIINEQKEKLKALDKTKTKFFNNVAHELRTPLTLMSGHMESMLNERFGGLNDGQRKSVLVAKQNTSKLMELVSEILDLGKLESDKLVLNAKPIPVKSFLDRIFFTFESLAHQFEIQLSFDYKLPEDLVLEVDDNKLEKVLNNLIHNAIKFTPRGGKVSFVTFQNEKDDFVFKVEDTGPGIPESELKHIFERYFQASTNDTQGGTGIGLTIVNEFTKLHGGQVSVESELGKGSSFFVELPNHLEASAPVEELEVEEEIKIPNVPIVEGREYTILIVDDHKEMQQYISSIVAPHAKTIIANDGVEALDLLEKNKVDLITLDVMMPNMDGFKFLRNLRSNKAYAKIPTIMLTARSAEEDKLEALHIGVNDYLTKPFSQAELMARIANLLTNRIEREAETVEEAETSTNNDRDEKLLNDLRELVLTNLDNSDFGVKELAIEINISEKQLTRTLKKITGLTPLKFIREIKLNRAMELLRSKEYHTVAEVCYAVGFEKPGYFTRIFTERFGKKPSEYLG